MTTRCSCSNLSIFICCRLTAPEWYRRYARRWGYMCARLTALYWASTWYSRCSCDTSHESLYLQYACRYRSIFRCSPAYLPIKNPPECSGGFLIFNDFLSVDCHCGFHFLRTLIFYLPDLECLLYQLQTVIV
jgi:hypothetical protein